MKPYSVDLRKRVLEAIDDVMTIDEVVEVFQVSKQKTSKNGRAFTNRCSGNENRKQKRF